jgi:hypothetical protein
MNNELALALFRDGLGSQLGGFSGGSCPTSSRTTQSSKLSSGTT